MHAVHPDYLEHRSIGRLILEFSTPAIIATVISATHNFVARIFVGQKIGMIGITAVTVSFPVTLLLLAFAMMIGTGATTLISIHLGQKRNDRAEKVLGQALLMYVVCAILFLLVGLFYLDQLLTLFGASEEVLPYARSYMSVLIWGGIFQEISYGVNNFIRAEGRPITAMMAMLIAVPINIFLDWLFLFPLEMGMAGAGLATVIAQIVSSIWVCWYYLSGRTLLRWRLVDLLPNRKLMQKIALFGTVPLATQSCSVLVQGLQYNVLGYYGTIYGEQVGLVGIDGGDLAISILGTIFVVAMLMVMPLLGLSQGIQPIVGYNVGAKRPDRVWLTLKQALGIGTIIASLFWFIGMFAPRMMLYPFVRVDDPAYQAIMQSGVEAFRVCFCVAPVVGITIVVSGYFQAHGRPVLSVILTLLRQLIFLIPLLILLPWAALYFGIGHGLAACWIAYPLSDFLAFCVAMIFLVREYTIKKMAINEMISRK